MARQVQKRSPVNARIFKANLTEIQDIAKELHDEIDKAMWDSLTTSQQHEIMKDLDVVRSFLLMARDRHFVWD